MGFKDKIANNQSGGIGEQVNAEILDQIFSNEHLNKTTDLNPKLVKDFARAKVIAELYDSSVLTMFTDEMKELLVSKNRKGREEMIRVVDGAREFEKDNSGNILKGLFNNN